VPHVLIAPDKFKGSATAAEVAESLASGLQRVLPGLPTVQTPVADGGDGTVAAALAAGFEPVEVTAAGPTGEPVQTCFARRGDLAVVELADVSGLHRLPGGRLAPLRASSRGTGEVVAAALDAGCRQVVLGVGGSACTDGGAGMAQALGARLLDADGRELPPGGAALCALETVDLAGLHPALAESAVVVASDVDNPLLGPRGAAAVYAPQKGADAAQVRLLEQGLTRWADAVRRATCADLADRPGAGAAGGVGHAALAVLGARLRPGIDLVLDLVGFEQALDDAALVLTGEGSLDEQTLSGKAPAGVAARAGRRGVPVVAVAGRSTLTDDQLGALGVTAAYTLADIEPDPQRCLREVRTLLQQLAARIARDHVDGPVMIGERSTGTPG
jgi:glycerate 2-kinase